MRKLLCILTVISTILVSCESEKEDKQSTSEISITESSEPITIIATIDSMWTQDSASLILLSADVVNNLKDTIRSLRWYCPPEYCHVVDNDAYKIYDTIWCYMNPVGIDYYPPQESIKETFLIRKLDESNSEFRIGIEIFDIPSDAARSNNFGNLLRERDDKKITYWSNIIKPE